jgi:putative acetyltransferase
MKRQRAAAELHVRQHIDVVIRAFLDSDLAGVVSCFTESVRVIAARHYGAEQIAVWAPIEPDLCSWRERLSSDGVLVAEVEGQVAGFARVERSGMVDQLYVHPTHERRGIGRELLNVACSWAAANGAKRFEANVSLAARPLFEIAGFRVEREQSVEYKGITFRNFRMVLEGGVVPTAEQPVAAGGDG